MAPRIDAYLRKVKEVDGSDLHISSLVVPKIRIHGKLNPLSEQLTQPEHLEEMLFEVLDERCASIYRKRNDLDMAIVRLTRKDPQAQELVSLTGVYHNLLRMWSEL